jgi:hypothetical protein
LDQLTFAEPTNVTVVPSLDGEIHIESTLEIGGKINPVGNNVEYSDVSSLDLIYFPGKVLGAVNDKRSGGQDFSITGVYGRAGSGYTIKSIEVDIVPIPKPATVSLFMISCCGTYLFKNIFHEEIRSIAD